MRTRPTRTEEHTCMRETQGQRGTERAVEERKCEADRQGTATQTHLSPCIQSESQDKAPHPRF